MLKISRHARNNMRLYNISETDILEAIESPDILEKEENKIIAIKKFQDAFKKESLEVNLEGKI